MEFSQGVQYKLDIAFVIDATGSMGPIMAQVKEQARSLGDKICDALEKDGKHVAQLRMRVIDFGDFGTEGDEAIHQTEFFTMPDGKAQFQKAIDDIVFDGRGGDDPENALEALYVAMNSDWVELNSDAGMKGRHIIVLMTDAYPLNLQERAGSYGYPDDLPNDINMLEGVWSAGAQDAMTQLSPRNKRLLLFAPSGADRNGHTWEAVSSWENTTMTIVNREKGLADLPLDDIIAEIRRSC